MKGFVYLLKDKEGKLYVGSTSDMKRRMSEHKRRHRNSLFTKNFNGVELIYFVEFEDLSLARLYESKIKKSRFERDKFYKKALAEKNIGE